MDTYRSLRAHYLATGSDLAHASDDTLGAIVSRRNNAPRRQSVRMSDLDQRRARRAAPAYKTREARAARRLGKAIVRDARNAA
jgi:hypothetical protein